ncbi:hypothetical protein T459_14113 [Capsicum annuum]|uniref:Uncharacterized protein n=1 Tax=Capsicum annuum TaxID=4072 RepID=A0A2G2ZGI3_CAPAN|nr:hypothetical protein T459_14113 [Capsicum annuum]
MEAMNSSSFHSSGENGGSSTEHDDFLQQILSSVPSSSSPWPDIGDAHPYNFDNDHHHHNSSLLASKLRQQQINGKALMLQQQLLMSRGLTGDQNDDALNQGNEISVQALYNGFAGSLGQTSNQSQHFHHSQMSTHALYFKACRSVDLMTSLEVPTVLPFLCGGYRFVDLIYERRDEGQI